MKKGLLIIIELWIVDMVDGQGVIKFIFTLTMKQHEIFFSKRYSAFRGITKMIGYIKFSLAMTFHHPLQVMGKGWYAWISTRVSSDLFELLEF